MCFCVYFPVCYWIIVCFLALVRLPGFFINAYAGILRIWELWAICLREPRWNSWKYNFVEISGHHRVDRILSFLSSRPNWVSLTPSLARECVHPPTPPFGSGKHTLWGGEGVGETGLQFKYTYTEWLKISAPLFNEYPGFLRNLL